MEAAALKYGKLDEMHSEELPAKPLSWKDRLFFVWVWKLLKMRERVQPRDLRGLPSSMLASHLRESSPRLFHRLIKLLGKELMLCTVLNVLSALLVFTGPLFIRLLGSYVSSEDKPLLLGLLLFFAFVLVTYTVQIVETQQQWMLNTIEIMVTTHFNSALYSKTLKVANVPENMNVNLVQIDTTKVFEAVQCVMNLVNIPIQISLALLFIYQEIGLGVLIGAGMLSAVAYLNYKMSSWIKKFYQAMALHRDQRVSLSRAVFGDIRMIKAYGWEAFFQGKIEACRTLEVKALFMWMFMWTVNIFALSAAPVITAIAVFMFYTQMSDESLGPNKAFVTLSSLFILQRPLRLLPFALTKLIQAKVSLSRIEAFLNLPETEAVHRAQPTTLTQCTFNSGSATVLRDVSLTLEENELVAVVGPVGSGKSSLLYALMGELELVSGSFQVDPSLSFAPSLDSWLVNDTVKANILFGNQFDATWYEQVIHACALADDLKQLPLGDESQVGERGALLSGGQRARVCLARAVYAKSSTILLDDPLSSVDVKVGAHLFNECILGLLSRTTRVLVTHQLQYATKADRVVTLNDGAIESISNTVPVQSIQAHTTTEVKTGIAQHSVEEKETGRVSRRVYLQYMAYSGGPGLFVLALLVMCFWVGCKVTGDYWLMLWSENNEATEYMYSYIGISLTSSLFVFCRCYLIMNTISIRASKKLHSNLLWSLLKAPVNLFYDITPLGRILNRLTRDLSTVDESFSLHMDSFLLRSFDVLASVLIQLLFFPWLVILVPILLLLTLVTAHFYLQSSRELTRLYATSRSVVVQQFSELLTGKRVIRCFDKGEYCHQRYEAELNRSAKVMFSLNATRCWVMLYMSCIAGIFLSGVVGMIIIFRHSISVGVVGLCMAYSFPLPMDIEFAVFRSTEMEKAAVSIERTEEYARVPPEHYQGERLLPLAAAPSITFRNVRMQYRPELDEVLKGVSFHIEAGEKIGIVGRTGSGKSSIFSVLLRLVELSEGSVLLNNKEISRFDLVSLRQSMTLIPQTPLLFEDSLRNNLDPLNQHSDNRLAEVLSKCQLEKFGLDFQVSPGRLSEGEKQLISIARAIVATTRVLLVDEATAGVDLDTDKLVQQLFQEHFAESTVLVVAHRLETVMHSDRLLVLNEGRLISEGTPGDLSTQSIYSLN